jgi:hypothetical protein
MGTQRKLRDDVTRLTIDGCPCRTFADERTKQRRVSFCSFLRLSKRGNVSVIVLGVSTRYYLADVEAFDGDVDTSGRAISQQA